MWILVNGFLLNQSTGGEQGDQRGWIHYKGFMEGGFYLAKGTLSVSEESSKMLTATLTVRW